MSDSGTQKKSFIEQFSGYVGLGLGLVLGRYAGIMLVFPAIGAVIGWFALARLRPALSKAIVAAAAAQIGQICWFAFALAMAGVNPNVIVELCVYIPLTIFLVWRPSVASIGLSIVYQLISVAINAFSLSQAPLFSIPSQGLVVHVAIRLYALGFLGVALWRSVKSAPAPA